MIKNSLPNRFTPMALGVLLSWVWGTLSTVYAQNDHKYTNALVHETSPYLLQHAHNPVDWLPWGEKARSRAKSQKKLMLISIGYSSCHWCHVMEEETFEDEMVAEFMNEKFIPIKVDREERPDIDELYQTFVSLIGKDRGWPLNIIALPNGKPLYGGLYHTKSQWLQVLEQVNDLYTADSKKAEEYANMIVNGIQEHNVIKPHDTEVYAADLPDKAIENWKPKWDMEWGGFTGENKFMLPSNLMLLLKYADLNEDEASKMHLKQTLDLMADRGIYDQVGGGFYRYSTDTVWKIPHFEKMLYDNAQLMELYAKAYKVFKDERYRGIVTGISDYLNREMRHMQGAYFSAMDADIDGEEGAYYVWKAEELKAVIKKEYDMFSAYYGIIPSEAWENNNYVLAKAQGLTKEAFAKKNGLNKVILEAKIKKWNEALLKQRQKREAPRIDDKIICSWNAMLVSGYVEAYKTFGSQEYLDKAYEIIGFLEKYLVQEGQLLHSYKKNSKVKVGFLEDYAFLIKALIDLYSVTMSPEHLEWALQLNRTVQENFADEQSQMFTYNNNAELISRIIKTDDGVIPSGNSVMAHNLFRIGQLLHDDEMLESSKEMLRLMGPKIIESMGNYANWGSLLLDNLRPYFQIAVVGENAKSLLGQINRRQIENAIIVGSPKQSDLPMFEYRFVDGDTLIYVCINNSCKMPVTSVKEAMDQIESYR